MLELTLFQSSMPHIVTNHRNNFNNYHLSRPSEKHILSAEYLTHASPEELFIRHLLGIHTILELTYTINTETTI